jgi:hypothetical protein
MTNGRLFVAAIMLLMVGFAGVFVLRPIIAPGPQAPMAIANQASGPIPRDARGTQYFMANIDEARQVVAGCREGSVRGGECANAETAIITVESKERFNRFRTEKK